MHTDDDGIQRLLHGELTPALEASVREHLATCASCRERVSAAGREEADVWAALRLVDHAPPRVDAETVAVRARAERLGSVRWAAGILLALGAASAAYAAPGSPLPRWVDTIVTRLSARPEPATSAPGEHAPGEAGIALDPGQNLVILLAHPASNAPEGRLHVSWSDGTQVVVRSSRGVASFTSQDAERLVVSLDGSPVTLEIQIPRDAPRVEIRVGDRRIFLKEGRSVAADAPSDTRGVYLLPLGAAGP